MIFVVSFNRNILIIIIRLFLISLRGWEDSCIRYGMDVILFLCWDNYVFRIVEIVDFF